MVDALRREGLNPVPVSITAGRRTRQANGMVYVPKRELVRGLVAAIEAGRFKTAKSLPRAEALVGKLRAFRVRLTAKGRDTYAARSGERLTPPVSRTSACGYEETFQALPNGVCFWAQSGPSEQ